MQAGGDDLDRPRDIEFTVVFPTAISAEQFADVFRAMGYRVSVEFTETSEGYPWDVIVAKQMLPSHAEIGSFEDLLQSVASPLDGHNDGWGCFRQTSPSTSAAHSARGPCQSASMGLGMDDRLFGSFAASLPGWALNVRIADHPTAIEFLTMPDDWEKLRWRYGLVWLA